MPLLHAVALGHEADRLAALPRHPWLEPVDLRDLDLPPHLAGNDLAESRFLLSGRADSLAESADFIGLLPARWDERFPRWPPLAEITSVTRWLGRDRLLAPSAHPIAHHRVGSWIRRQDEVHPGIADLLTRVQRAWSADDGGSGASTARSATARSASGSMPRPRDRVGPGWGTAVWGNTFIVHREEFRELLTAFRAAFTIIQAEHGLDLPHEYRCPRCGRTSPWGVGRWSDDRHASYLAERVTGLHFALRSGLTLIDHRGRLRLPTRRQKWAQRIPAAVQEVVERTTTRHARRPRPCDPTDPRACA